MNRREKLAVRFLVEYIALTLLMALHALLAFGLYEHAPVWKWVLVTVIALLYFACVMIRAKRFIDGVERVE